MTDAHARATGRGGSAGPRVRRASLDDAAAIAALLRDLGYAWLDAMALTATLKALLERPDLALFLAIDRAGRSLGLVQLSHRPQVHLGGTQVSIDALVVSAEARGQGIGRRLLRRARAYARCHQAVRVEVHTNRGRESYRRGFYAANGFREANSALFRLAELERKQGPALPGTARAPTP